MGNSESGNHNSELTSDAPCSDAVSGSESERSAAILRGIIESTADGILVVDGDWRLIHHNQRLAEMWRLPEALLEPDAVELLFLHAARQVEDSAGFLRRLRSIGRSDEESTDLLEFTDGRVVEAYSRPLRSSELASGRVFSFRDITKRRRAEEAAKRGYTKLEAMVTELVQAKRDAEQASVAKGQFLANMSHEIRTPLNGVIGLTELALRSSLESDLEGQLQMVRSSALSLMSLVDEILDFSQIEAGKVELNSAPFSLRKLLDDSLEVLAIKAEEKGLAFHVEVPAAIPDWLIGDAGRLRQVLVKLVGNAVKFTERGEVSLRVEPFQSTEAEACLRFSIRDTGIGIASDRHAEIFEAFAQADFSTTRRYGGSGLGLAISTHLVELMGGELRVESSTNKGATFWFQVRFSHAKAQNQGRVEPSRPEPVSREITSVAPCECALRVLLAEDNPINQKVAAGLLAHRGHRVEVVNDGAAAVEAARQGDFDVILMDVQMPEMDGLEATRLIRQFDRRDGRRRRIVAMTAHAMAEDQERCLSAGMDSYLPKPFLPEDLFAAVELRGASDAPSVGRRGSTADPGAVAVLDRVALDARTRGDTKLMFELVEIFRTSAPALIEKMRAGHGADDADQVFRAAHCLKGAASMMGAEEVQQYALAVEMLGRRGRLEGAPEAIAAIEHAVERLLLVLLEMESGG
jgi:PAS domain S-box-containing protein